jgi:hypothetical protein
MLDEGGKKTRGQLDNTPEAIEVWAAELAQRWGGRPVALALEQSRGAVITVLSKYAHLVLFPVHPTSLANYRKSFSPSGAKCDPVDGDLILDYLVKHPEQLRCLRPDTVETRSLQFLTEERRKLVDAHTAALQSLIHWLKQVFPQILRWFDDPATPLVADLLMRWPTLQELQKSSPKTLRKFFHQHNCRSEDRTEERLEQLRQAVPATHDPALLRAGTLSIQNATRILASMRQGIAEFDRQIAVTYQAHPDRFITESLPGAGPALEPRLIAAVGSQRDRFPTAYNMNCCFGVATPFGSTGAGPAPRSSGKPFMNGRGVPSEPAIGLASTTTGNAPRVTDIMPQFDLWHSSGFASSSAAGAIVSPTPTNAMKRRSASAPPSPSLRQRQPRPTRRSLLSGNPVEAFRNSRKF